MSKIAVNSVEELVSHFPPLIPERLPTFANRKEAGQRLARALERYRWQGPLILAISPRAVEVGLEVAQAYDSWPEASEEDFLNFLVQWYNLSNRRRNESR